MDVIETKGLSKDYGHGRGIFDVTFEVHKGEVYGFLGPNGAGKSTTMRHLMGFSRPKSGDAYIGGKDCWKDHAAIMKSVGYLPGVVIVFVDLIGLSCIVFTLFKFIITVSASLRLAIILLPMCEKGIS